MPRRNSTPGSAKSKPAKPYPGFPLYAHAAGVWAKKIRGKVHYFGKWSDWKAALAEYERQKDDLHSGQTPKTDPDAVTVKDVANAFLVHKKERLDTGELSVHTYAKYQEAVEQLQPLARRAVVDLNSADFAALRKSMAQRWGPYRLADMIQHIRSAFKHAYDADLIDRPMRFGPGFARPTKKVQRLHRAQKGPNLFTAAEVRRLIDAAGVQQRAMILLGINCGFGNSDCANLPLRAVDLDAAMIDFPRPKTGLERRCPLWPETVTALRAALAKRPLPKDETDAGLFFVTRRGGSYGASETDRPIAQVMAWLLRRLKINGRKGLGFYTLRHTFRTISGGAKDPEASLLIMGQELPGMSSVYVEEIEDDRLRAVAEHVRQWLFPSALKIHAAS